MLIKSVYAVQDAAELQDLESVFEQVLSLATIAAGLAVFVMFIVGGFRYLTSGGDPKAAASARGTLTWAVAGLAIFISAWFILKFIEFFTGVQVTIFEIPG